MALYDAVKAGIEAVFIVFHLSVVLCILNERWQKNHKFASAFYTLYILQTFFDMIFVLTYGICIGLANFGIFVPLINVGLALGTYSQLGQGISHSLISYNRFTAIAQPLRNKQIWSKRNIWLACVFAVLTPLPTALIKLQVQYTLVANNATGGYNVAYAGTIFATLNGFLTFAYCATGALISAAFEIATFLAYYKLTRAARLKYREDYKLLLYAASQFIGQLLAAFCASNTIVKAFMSVPFYFTVVPYVFHITVDILGLSAPVCLLFTRFDAMEGRVE